ncbi:MAG: hypothetical protein KDC87_15805 [Planctomycetes bacterium]|nr:hypothetical protein [Planctomycetota bacterium]MCB9870516.1 hypothetical protein [Planctomycetota bacterium]
MNLHNFLLVNALILSFAPAATSQIKTSYYQTQSRGSSSSKTVGNSWLGATLVATAGMSHTTGPGYEAARAYASLTGTARVLASSGEIGHLSTTGTNTIAFGNQTRAASTEVRILGSRWVSTSSTGNTLFLKAGYNLSLFSRDHGVNVDVGPLGIALYGNAAVSLYAGGGFQMPTGDPQVKLTAYAYTSAYARAKAGISIPGAGVEVTFNGALGRQTLDVSGSASPRTGFTGSANYTITPIAIKIVLHAWVLWGDYYRTLVNTTAGTFQKRLF